MLPRIGFLLVVLAFSSKATALDQHRIEHNGAPRTYWLHVPSKPTGASIVLLHGSGGEGSSMCQAWQQLAEKHGITLIAPEAQRPRYWLEPQDGPKFISAVIEDAAKMNKLDRKRIYLFGFSAGGDQALYLALAQSKYFAAVATYASALRPRQFAMADITARKVPVLMFIGDQDRIYSVDEVRETHKALKSRNFTSRIEVLPGADHAYFDRYNIINKTTWDFFKDTILDSGALLLDNAEQMAAFALK